MRLRALGGREDLENGKKKKKICFLLQTVNQNTLQIQAGGRYPHLSADQGRCWLVLSFRLFHLERVVQLDMNIHVLEREGIPAVSRLVTHLGLYFKNIFGAYLRD